MRANSILRKRTDGLLGLQGWEKVGFQGADSTPPGFTYADKSCAAVTINARMPANRAGHTAVSTGSQALVCGGYTLKTPARTTFAGAGNDIECWWFTPTPQPRFDPFKWQPGTYHKPETRWGHAMAQHSVTGALVMFGGMRNTTASVDPLASPVLQDCWFLELSNNGSKTVSLVAEYQWKRCDPSSPTVLRPMPRYGSVAIFHAGTSSVYISGGFAWTGTTFLAMSDLWALLHYDHDPVWSQINPISETPVGRGFHAAWLFGNSPSIYTAARVRKVSALPPSNPTLGCLMFSRWCGNNLGLRQRLQQQASCRSPCFLRLEMLWQSVAWGQTIAPLALSLVLTSGVAGLRETQQDLALPEALDTLQCTTQSPTRCWFHLESPQDRE